MTMDVDLSGLFGKINRLQQAVKESVEETAEKAAEEVLEKAIEYASGPMNPEWKRKMAQTAKSKKTRQQTKRKVVRKFDSDAEYRWYKEVMSEMQSSQPWPVSVNTGTFRRAHRAEKIGPGVWRVFGDSSIAKYFSYVHDGTVHMRGRPTIGKAVQEFKRSERIKEIGRVILHKKLSQIRG